MLSILIYNDSAAGQQNFGKVWGQYGGQLQTFWSRNWFTNGPKDIAGGCVMAWQISNPKELLAGPASQAVTLGSSTTAGAISGYKTYHYLAANTSQGAATDITDWVDPIANSTALSLRLANYYLKGGASTATSIVSVSTDIPVGATIPATVKIWGKVQIGMATPGGQYYTINPAALGYKQFVPALAPPTIAVPAKVYTGLTCTITSLACILSFNIWTNCLKWVAAVPDSNKFLYAYLDVIYRYLPSNTEGLINNGPSTTIRLVKLFPEPQAMQDVQKKTTHTDIITPFIFHHAHVTPESQISVGGQGGLCMVELVKEFITKLGTVNSNVLALFLFNISLIHTDVMDAASTYPIGSLDTGISAWGLSSAPVYSNIGHMGCPNTAFSTFPTTAKSVGYGAAGLMNIFSQNAYTAAMTTLVAGTSVSLTTRGPFSNRRTMYPFLMGSVILITGITKADLSNPIKNVKIGTTAGNQNMFIPTKCPNQKYTLNDSSFTSPTIYVTSMIASDYKTFSSVEKILYSNVASSLNSIITSYETTFKATSVDATLLRVIKPRFLDYNTDTSSSKLDTYAGNSVSLCTAFMVFLASDINFDTAANGVTVSTITDPMSYYSSTKFMYVWGKKFNKVVSIGYSTTASTYTALDATIISFTGILRPTDLTTWAISTATSSTGAFTLDDKIGVFCANSVVSVVYYMSNVVVTATTMATKFVSYLATPTVITTGGVLTTTVDSGVNYKSDPSGNLLISATFPALVTKLPKYSSIILTSANAFSAANIICGVKTTESTQDCVRGSGIMTCSLPSTISGNVVICCYNVTIVTDPSITSISLNLDGILTLQTTGSKVATYTPDVPGTYTFPNDTTNIDVTTLVASLSNLTYNPAQINALGVLSVEITLPRDIPRDGKIIFEGDFKTLFAFTTAVPKTSVRCMASMTKTGLGSSWTTGDALIDLCDISKLDETADSIVIVTKKIVYKCGLVFDKVLYIDLLPVQLGQIVAATLFRVFMKGGGGGATAASHLIKSSSSDLAFSKIPTLLAKPTVNFTPLTLCGLAYNNVYPRIPGGLTDFTFTFDLTTNSKELTTASADKPINEVTIFLPYAQFGDYANSDDATQTCTIDGKKVFCMFSKPGVLNVMLSTSAVSGTNFSVSLLNVPVGAFDTNLTFFCSVNNLTNGVRQNFLTGSGAMAANTTGLTGIVQKALWAKTYNLISYATYQASATSPFIDFYASTKAQRDSGTLTLRVGVDFYLAWKAQTAITISATPTFHIYLPKEFKNLWYQYKSEAAFSPSVSIAEYTLSDAGEETRLLEVATSPVVVSGNRLSITCTGDLLVSLKHRFYEIIISGLTNPNPGDTGMFNVAIANADYTYLLRTWTSSQNQVNFEVPLVYNSISTETGLTIPSLTFAYKKGLTFGLALKWDTTLNKGLNTMSVNAGRYSKQSWDLTKNAVLAVTKAGSTVITLSDNTFSVPANTKYELFTKDLTINLLVGTSCLNAINGKYVVFFKGSSTDFYNLPPVLATVVTGTKGSVKFGFEKSATSTIPGGTLPATYTINADDTNFDELTCAWKGKSTNDATAAISCPKIPPNSTVSKGAFSIDTVTVVTNQEFTLDFTSNCFTFSASTALVALTGIPITLPSSVSEWFVFQTPSTDKVLTAVSPTKLNALRWIVTPTAFPINIYCSLVCKNAATPTDADIIGKLSTVSTMNKYWSQYFASTAASDVLFEGLIRGQAYKISCVVQTTETKAENRKSSSFSSSSVPSSSPATDYIPTPVESTVCLSLTFSELPTDTMKNAILGYCQLSFSLSAAKPITGGGVVCVDLDGKTARGYSLPAAVNVTCPSAATRLRRVLSTPPASPTTPTPTTPAPTAPKTPAPYSGPTFIYRVCATPSVLSPTNAVFPARRLRDLKTTRELQTPAPTPAPAPATGVSKIISSIVLAALKDEKTASATLGITVKVLSVAVVEDSVAPVLTGLITYGATSSDSTGKFSAVVNFSSTTVSYTCYYQVISGTTAPTSASIKSCVNTTSCGKVILQSPSVTVSNQVSPAFSIGVDYTLWLVCFNSVPNAQLASEVLKAYTFKVACPAGQTNTNGVCVATPTGTTTGGSSNFLSMCIGMISLMIFLILG